MLQHLETIENRPGLDPEFYCYQIALVQGELTSLQTEIDQLLDEHPDLQNFITSQLQAELQAIKAETYAEFVRAGQLNRELSPFLHKRQKMNINK